MNPIEASAIHKQEQAWMYMRDMFPMFEKIGNGESSLTGDYLDVQAAKAACSFLCAEIILRNTQ